MKKNILIAAILFIVLLVITFLLYISIGFYFVTLNPFYWSSDARLLMSGIFFILVLIYVAISSTLFKIL